MVANYNLDTSSLKMKLDLSKDFSTLFNNSTFSDFVIRVKNQDQVQSIRCHLCILIPRWKSFRVQHVYRDTEDEVIQKVKNMRGKMKLFENVSAKCVKDIVKFLYTDNFRLFRAYAKSEPLQKDLVHAINAMKLNELLVDLDKLFKKKAVRSPLRESFDCIPISNANVDNLDNDKKIIIWAMKALSDVKLLSDNQIIYAHKTILACKSDYFHAMFVGNFDDKFKDQIEIEDTAFETLLSVVRYLYSDTVELKPENVIDILFTSNKLNISELQKQCEEYIEINLTKEDAFKVFEIAEHLNLHCLKEACKKFMIQRLVYPFILDLRRVELYLIQNILSFLQIVFH